MSNAFPSDYLERVKQTANQLEQDTQTSLPARDVDRLDRALEQGISLMQDGQWQTIPGPVKAQLINGLGLNYYTRYQINGSPDDINKSIQLFEQALELVASTQRRRASVLSNLSAALQLRHTRLGELSDIKQAVETALQSVELVSADLPEKPSYLSNLTGALYERYSTYGQIEDLDTAIHSTEEAIALTSEASTRRGHRINNLAALHQERYSRLGELKDLMIATSLYRDVVTGTASEDQNYPIYLNNLGGCLLDLYRRNKNLDDLNSAIETLRAAIKITTAGSPHRPGFLNNLGNALSAFFQKTGDLTMLGEAVEVQHEAEKMVAGSPLQASFLTGLGSSLIEYYLKTQDQASLDKAVEVCKRSIDLTPSNSPKLASRWNNLARSLMERCKLIARPEDLEDAQLAYLKACENGMALQTEVTLIAGYNWGEWALQRHAWTEAAEALELAMLASKELFQRQTLRLERESWLREAQVLPAMACFAQAKSGNFMKAVMALETGRTRILAEMLHLYDAKLEILKEGEHNIYFERYSEAVDRLTQLDKREVDLTQNQEAAREARLELSRVIREIQMLPGFGGLFQDLEIVDIQSILAESNLDAIIYIVITSVGGLALIADKENIEPLWLDIDSRELDRVMLGDTNHPEKGYLGAILGYVSTKVILESVCRWLGEKVVKPISTRLEQQKVEKICLIPTGSLALLPLNAAQYSENGEIHTWLENIIVSHSPSLIILRRGLDALMKFGGNSLSLVGIANPAPLPEQLPFLQFALAELEAVSTFFPHSAILLTGEEASVENVVASLSSASFLHFGCHATFDTNEPFNSGIILSRGERLRVQDLLGRPVFTKSRLAVLSSCQTAIIDFSKIPEEAIGLPAGFLQAGMPAVISTLWQVNDLSTAMLMIKFYQYFLESDLDSISEPMSTAKALQRSQLWLRDLNADQIDEFVKTFLPTLVGRAHLRKDATFAHPYYWAGFTLSGV